LGVVPCGIATWRCVAVCLYAYNVSNIIILVNKGFVKSYIVFSDKLTDSEFNQFILKTNRGPTKVGPRFNECLPSIL
jgi:hypothetical protein